MSVTELVAIGALIFGAGGIVASLRNVHASVTDIGKRLRNVELQLAKLLPAADLEERV